MKTTVLYYSKTGNTRRMAEVIAAGMQRVSGVEARAMSIEQIDLPWLTESACVVLGCPTYYTGAPAAVDTFLYTARKYNLAGKLAGAFATEDYLYGGAETALHDLMTRMLFWGVLFYSGGYALGDPPIHMGPIALSDRLDEAEPLFALYGERMAAQAKTLFGD